MVEAADPLKKAGLEVIHRQADLGSRLDPLDPDHILESRPGHLDLGRTLESRLGHLDLGRTLESRLGHLGRRPGQVQIRANRPVRLGRTLESHFVCA